MAGLSFGTCHPCKTYNGNFHSIPFGSQGYVERKTPNDVNSWFGLLVRNWVGFFLCALWKNHCKEFQNQNINQQLQWFETKAWCWSFSDLDAWLSRESISLSTSKGVFGNNKAIESRKLSNHIKIQSCSEDSSPKIKVLARTLEVWDLGLSRCFKFSLVKRSHVPVARSVRKAKAS